MTAGIPISKTETPLPLGQDLLGDLDPAVDYPSYDRSALTPAIVHIGVGGFHRAHQGVYFDDVAERGISTEWGIVGVGLRRPRMKEALAPQDWLYTVIERDSAIDRARVIGSMIDYHFAPDDPEAVLGALADPRTRIVTLTVTGGAYKLDAEGSLDLEDPEVAADLATPHTPVTVPGYLVEGLRRRRAAGLPPFTVMSCDNLPSNGAAAREAVVSLASRTDRVLAQWIDSHGAFPSSVVDRITPETTGGDRDLVATRFGIRDRWPVVTEPYTQWIVEDDFCNGRPPLEEVGVQFVADAASHELTKKRLLNGGHSALGYLGYLAGYRRTDEAVADPALAEFLAAMMSEEIEPALPEAGGLDLDEYRDSLIRRFANPGIGDRLARLCSRGSVKMPAYLLPSLSEAIAEGRPHDRLTLAVAAWFLHLRGTDLAGQPVTVNDPAAPLLSELATTGAGDPRPLLTQAGIFGALAHDEAFAARLEEAIARLEDQGVHGAITSIRSDDSMAVAA